MNVIQDYIAESLISIASDKTVIEAAKAMEDYKIHSLLVEEGGDYIGIVTESDFGGKVIVADKNPATLKVKDIMNFPLIKVEGSETMETAAALMEEKNVRHLLVSQHDQVAGILSIHEFFKYFLKKNQQT